jgi:methionyl-tRNA formyltransferase
MPVNSEISGKPGTVIDMGNNDMGIITGKGLLKITGLQYEGKRAMHAKAFMQGQRDFTGSILPS